MIAQTSLFCQCCWLVGFPGRRLSLGSRAAHRVEVWYWYREAEVRFEPFRVGPPIDAINRLSARVSLVFATRGGYNRKTC